MKIAVHQPQYFPWPPYVHKVMSADIFVYLDTVQFSKNGLQNRNQIKTAAGPLWLTVPVKHEFGRSIRETQIADPHAAEKHWKTLVANYGRTSGFRRWQEELQQLLQTPAESLSAIAIASTEWMLTKLGVKTTRMRASEIPALSGHASTLVANICKTLRATHYLTGTGALEYLNPADFCAIDCSLMVQQWRSFSYEQVNKNAGFIGDLSTLDLLLNCPDSAAGLIESAGTWLPYGQANQ